MDPFDECSESYFQCVEDDNSGRMHLIKKTCPNDEVFDEGEGECKGISAGVGPGRFLVPTSLKIIINTRRGSP